SKFASEGMPVIQTSSGMGAGANVTFGGTSPTYSTRATVPSGSGTFITWLPLLAAIAAPAIAAAAIPARVSVPSFITKRPPTSDVTRGEEVYRAILNAGFLRTVASWRSRSRQAARAPGAGPEVRLDRCTRLIPLRAN